MNLRASTPTLFAAAFLVPLLAASVHAGEADVIDVEVQRQGDGIYRFDVTVRHDDEGWDHYADKWIVEDGNGFLLGERVLLHPHVNEQPFTRSLSGIAIPDDVDTVVIRARDSIHKWGGREIDVEIPQ